MFKEHYGCVHRLRRSLTDEHRCVEVSSFKQASIRLRRLQEVLFRRLPRRLFRGSLELTQSLPAVGESSQCFPGAPWKQALLQLENHEGCISNQLVHLGDGFGFRSTEQHAWAHGAARTANAPLDE